MTKCYLLPWCFYTRIAITVVIIILAILCFGLKGMMSLYGQTTGEEIPPHFTLMIFYAVAFGLCFLWTLIDKLAVCVTWEEWWPKLKRWPCIPIPFKKKPWCWNNVGRIYRWLFDKHEKKKSIVYLWLALPLGCLPFSMFVPFIMPFLMLECMFMRSRKNFMKKQCKT